MTEYRCKECGKLQYTADTKSTTPCTYCGGECVITELKSDVKEVKE
jgi:DNA-directed RNA polymerase subunit RPC12/RpoP